MSFSQRIMHAFLLNGSSIFSTHLCSILDLLIFLYFQPFPPSTSTHSCFLVKKRSSLLAEVTRVRMWLPMMCSCLNMVVLEVLLVIRVTPLRLRMPTLPSEPIAAILLIAFTCVKVSAWVESCCPPPLRQVLRTGWTLQIVQPETICTFSLSRIWTITPT